MTVAVYYVSRGEKTSQNTKSAAEIVAKEFGVQAIAIDETTNIDSKVDLLWVGSGTYNNTPDEKVTKFVDRINTAFVGQLVPFATAGGSGGCMKKIHKQAQSRGIQVVKKGMLIRMFRHTQMTDNREVKIKKYVAKLKTANGIN